MMTSAANYTAERTSIDSVEVVRLTDSARQTEILIAPSIGNIAVEMKVRGKRVLWSPYNAIAEWKAKPAMGGNPLLAPWANRLDQPGFHANGRRFALNLELGNVRMDGHKQPIHGLLLHAAEWEVKGLKADSNAAEVTSRLDFWRYPAYMAQFPFAHSIEMTYRLRDGALEVETVVENHASEAMPVSLGYHPYFQVNDAPRDEWVVELPVRERVMLSNTLVPTGERKPVSFSGPFGLKNVQLDDVYTGLVRDGDGRSAFSVKGRNEKVSVIYGPKYTTAVVYAPAGRDFICFEPMTGPTNAFNLAHAGLYQELQTIPPKSQWRESFWIVPSGY
ncbi:MAG: aldose 1-epimerase [Bryobacteraceae bacterium]